MGVKYEIVATIGKYQKEGEQKYINRKVGVIMETQNGVAIKIDPIFTAAGCVRSDDGSVWLNLYPPKDNNAPAPPPAPPPSQFNNNDDIPFF